jgi:hypothetical protein
MGCSRGNIYTFDPYLMGDGKISKYYQSKPPCIKKRKVEIVKWFEPSSEEENVNKFLVVYDDGTIYIFFLKQNQKDDDPALQLTLKHKGSDGITREYAQETIIKQM